MPKTTDCYACTWELRSRQHTCTDDDVQRYCYHPLSCRRCDSAGAPCGGHHTGDREHASCSGRDW